MEPLREVARTVRDHWRRGRAKRAIAPLAEHPEPRVQALHAGLTTWLDDAHADDDALARVEQLRDQLSASSDRLGDDGAAIAPLVEQTTRPAYWCRLHHALLRELRPEGAVEFGSALGLTTAYQATALVQNDIGCLIGMEPDADQAARAIETVVALELSDRARIVTGRYDELLDDVLADLRPLPHALLGHHADPGAKAASFQRLLPALGPSATVVIDDIRSSPDMEFCWSSIAHDSAVSVAVDLGPVGIVVVGHRHGDPVRIDARLTD